MIAFIPPHGYGMGREQRDEVYITLTHEVRAMERNDN